MTTVTNEHENTKTTTGSFGPLARAGWAVTRHVRPSHRPLRSTCYYVLGMHRSGTSCLTGLLETAGLVVDNVRRKAKYNPKGNLEDRDVRTVNDQILAQFGGDWKSPPASIDVDAVDPRALRAAIERYRNAAAWVVKDPRMLFTLDAWLPHTPSHRFIGTYRHPHSTAGSLANRNAIPLDDGIAIWTAYNKRLLELHDRYGFPLVCFDDVGDSYLNGVRSACAILGLDWQEDAARGFYENALVNQRAEMEAIADPIARSVYDRLRTRHSHGT